LSQNCLLGPLLGTLNYAITIKHEFVWSVMVWLVMRLGSLLFVCLFVCLLFVVIQRRCTKDSAGLIQAPSLV